MKHKTPEEEHLQFTIDELRQYYVERDGNQMLPRNDRYNKIFKKAAELCIKLDAFPKDFVDSQFVGINGIKMQPEFLSGPKATERYETYMSGRQLPLDSMYDLQKMYLRNQILRTTDSVEEILLDDDLKFHPWFRICITKEPIAAVLDKYQAEAKELFNPKLKQFLTDRKLDYKRITND